MIDDEFHPDRVQLEALGQLFLAATRQPCFPVMSELALYEFVGQSIKERRPGWFTELEELGLVAYLNEAHKTDFQNVLAQAGGSKSDGVALTPAGVHYCASHSANFHEQQYGVTRDLDEDAIEAIWIINNHFRASEEAWAPGSDRIVAFDHNSPEHQETLNSIDAVAEALAADNEIGAKEPDKRDAILSELTAIREALLASNASSSKLALMSWGTLGYLITHFADRPVAHFADLAWSALKHYLGI